MSQVRTAFKVAWYRCPIEPAKLKELTARSDLRGAAQSLGFLALVAVVGAAYGWGGALSPSGLRRPRGPEANIFP